MTDYPNDASAERPDGDASTTWGDTMSHVGTWAELPARPWTDVFSRNADDELGEAA